MKKFIFSLMLIMGMVLNVNAQTALQQSKVLDNTYLGVNAGVNTPLSFNHVFPLNTVVGLRFGKDFSPVFGVNAEATVGFGDHASTILKTKDDKGNYVVSPYNHFRFKDAKTFVSNVMVGLNTTLNWSNLLFGYHGSPRVFEVSTIHGIAWQHIYDAPTADNDELLAKTGFDIAWNLGKAKAWQLYLEPAVLWNLTYHNHDAVKFNKNFAVLQLAVGVNYKFKTSNGTHNFKTYDIGAMNDKINALHAELANKPNEVVKEVVKTVDNGNPWVVYFAQGSSDLTNEAKAILDGVSTDKAVDVVATASPEGTRDFNEHLSVQRAEAVANYLTNRGVKVNSVEGLGVVGNASNRVAIVTANK